MNKERLSKLADVIEENLDHFNQRWWVNVADEWLPQIVPTIQRMDTLECGTTMCVAGWAVHLWGADAREQYDIKDAASEILDLTNDQANELFEGTNQRPIEMLREWSA